MKWHYFIFISMSINWLFGTSLCYVTKQWYSLVNGFPSNILFNPTIGKPAWWFWPRFSKSMAHFAWLPPAVYPPLPRAAFRLFRCVCNDWISWSFCHDIIRGSDAWCGASTRMACLMYCGGIWIPILLAARRPLALCCHVGSLQPRVWIAAT